MYSIYIYYIQYNRASWDRQHVHALTQCTAFCIIKHGRMYISVEY